MIVYIYSWIAFSWSEMETSEHVVVVEIACCWILARYITPQTEIVTFQSLFSFCFSPTPYHQHSLSFHFATYSQLYSPTTTFTLYSSFHSRYSLHFLLHFYHFYIFPLPLYSSSFYSLYSALKDSVRIRMREGV